MNWLDFTCGFAVCSFTLTFWYSWLATTEHIKTMEILEQQCEWLRGRVAAMETPQDVES